MPSLLGYFRLATAALRARLAEARRNGDAGYTTETVLVIALLVALALAAIAIIAAKVLAKANSLNLGG
jgi:fatty acid desaturase